MNPEFQDRTSQAVDETVPVMESNSAELHALRKELLELKALRLGQTSDFDEFKRRTRLETEARASAQKDAFISELLPSLDDLERALASGAAHTAPQLYKGVEMTLHQLRALLQHHGIETEESLGQMFDPRRHEALSLRHDPAHFDHAVIEVFQRGYRKGGRVFRPAKVVVNDLTLPKQSRHVR